MLYYDGYSIWRYIGFAVIIILLVGFLVGGAVLYNYLYHYCMFISVSDLPGYCLTFL